MEAMTNLQSSDKGCESSPIVIQPTAGFTIEQLLNSRQSGPGYYTELTKPEQYPLQSYPYALGKENLLPFKGAQSLDENQNTLDNESHHTFEQTSMEAELFDAVSRGLSLGKRKWHHAFQDSYETRPSVESTSEDTGNHDTMFEIVVKAIMNCKEGEILLGDIYNYIVSNYAKFRDAGKTSWRVTVRHALSVNSCFIKGKKAQNGRGYYWKIHPVCFKMFSENNFDKKRSAKLVQETLTRGNHSSSMEDHSGTQESTLVEQKLCSNLERADLIQESITVRKHKDEVRHYVPMTTIPLTSYTYYDLLVNICELRDQQ